MPIYLDTPVSESPTGLGTRTVDQDGEGVTYSDALVDVEVDILPLL